MGLQPIVTDSTRWPCERFRHSAPLGDVSPANLLRSKKMNLLLDPWIPLRRRSGVVEVVAPWQITDSEEADPFTGFASVRPDFDGALSVPDRPFADGSASRAPPRLAPALRAASYA